MNIIQTEYKGYRFRSRLEARWAVFFDVCGAKWEYEPEGFELDNGLYYLPDFLLHDVFLNHQSGKTIDDLYVEVKGYMTREDDIKIASFCGVTLACGEFRADETIKMPTLILLGFPDGDDIWELDDYCYNIEDEYSYAFNFYPIDGDYFPAIPGINSAGRFELFGADGTYRIIGTMTPL